MGCNDEGALDDCKFANKYSSWGWMHFSGHFQAVEKRQLHVFGYDGPEIPDGARCIEISADYQGIGDVLPTLIVRFEAGVEQNQKWINDRLKEMKFIQDARPSPNAISGATLSNFNSLGIDPFQFMTWRSFLAIDPKTPGSHPKLDTGRWILVDPTLSKIIMADF